MKGWLNVCVWESCFHFRALHIFPTHKFASGTTGLCLSLWQGSASGGWGGGSICRDLLVAAASCLFITESQRTVHRLCTRCSEVLQAVKPRECQENENVLQPCAPAKWLHACPSWKAPIWGCFPPRQIEYPTTNQGPPKGEKVEAEPAECGDSFLPQCSCKHQM